METLDSSIFDLTPIPMWIEDFSEVKQQFDLWRKQGIENLHEFLNLNKQKRVGKHSNSQKLFCHQIFCIV